MAAELDWSKLPPELKYLAVPAEKFGPLQFDDPVYEFLQEKMTPAERADLQALRQRWAEDGDAIEAWLDQFNMMQHREARLVYFTGYLLAVGADLKLL